MKAFEALNLKINYRHNRDNLVEDFYIPVLSKSNKFLRAAGYFSSSIFEETLIGIENFIQNDGEIKLVTSYNLTEKDLSALEGLTRSKKDEYISKSLNDVINENIDGPNRKSVEIFCWLISNKKLELKIAFGDTKDSFTRLFHEKIGVLESVDGEMVAFEGSLNESKTAYTLNFEKISLFTNWKDGDKERFDSIYYDFWDLWNNATDGLSVFELSSDVLSSIKKISTNVSAEEIPKHINNLNKKFIEKFKQSEKEKTEGIKTPEWFENGVYDHQKKAWENWRENGFNGLLSYATGSGKTLTALYCAANLYRIEKKLFIVVSVPQIFIAEQWVKELKEFGVTAVKCYGNKKNWHSKLDVLAQAYNIGAVDLVAVVVVNATMIGREFQSIINKIKRNLLFIGDEAHNLGAKNNLKSLPSKKFSLGLSATPVRHMDEEGTERMLEYFGGVIAEFTLNDALELKVLTPYYYKIIPVYFNKEEEDEFIQLSKEIRRYSSYNREGDGPNERVKMLLIKRSRIIANCKNKIEKLADELRNNLELKKAIIYCGAGTDEETDEKLINLIVRTYTECTNSTIAKFTSCETLDQRDSITRMLLNDDISAIAAIKCLDEGVDLPAVEAAYFLASGVNEKEFVQRRGRVLRKSPGKKYSYIYDFVVLPDLSTMEKEFAKMLYRREFARIKEFAGMALNKNKSLEQVEHLEKLIE